MEETIDFEMLSEQAQQTIIDEDPDETLAWYAKREGSIWDVTSRQKNLLDLLEATGGMGKGWMRVAYQRD